MLRILTARALRRKVVEPELGQQECVEKMLTTQSRAIRMRASCIEERMKTPELLFEAHRASLPARGERTAAHRQQTGEHRARPEPEIE